jgi:large subunit ribosomal protein L30
VTLVPEVHLKQVRSPIGSDKKQLATLRTLKLGRIGRESKLEDTPQFRGALAKVEHLVERVEEGSDARGKSTSNAGAGKGSDPSEGS